MHQIYALSQVQHRKGRNFQIADIRFDFCWTSTYFKVSRLSRQIYTDLRNQNILIWLVFMKTFTPLQKNHINIICYHLIDFKALKSVDQKMGMPHPIESFKMFQIFKCITTFEDVYMVIV